MIHSRTIGHKFTDKFLIFNTYGLLVQMYGIFRMSTEYLAILQWKNKSIIIAFQRLQMFRISYFFFIKNVFKNWYSFLITKSSREQDFIGVSKLFISLEFIGNLQKITVKNLSILKIKFYKQVKVFFLWRQKLIIIYFNNSFKLFFQCLINHPHFNHKEGGNRLLLLFSQNKVRGIHETFKVSLLNILPKIFKNYNEFELFFSLTETPQTCYRCHV